VLLIGTGLPPESGDQAIGCRPDRPEDGADEVRGAAESVVNSNRPGPRRLPHGTGQVVDQGRWPPVGGPGSAGRFRL